MNYIFYYSGKIPKHVLYSIHSVFKSDEDANIFFCNDSFKKFEGVNFISSDDVQSKLTKEVENKFMNESKKGLWGSSMLRLFYLLDVANKNNLQNFVHFDSDVLLYKSYKDIYKILNQKKFNITPLNDKNLVFGYSFIGNLNVYEAICNYIFEILLNKKDYEQNYLNGKSVTEMSALGIVNKKYPDLFNLLPVLPSEERNITFDPGSYGQYLGGVDKKIFSRGYASENHYVGKKIIKKEIFPGFDFSIGPYVETSNQKHELVNLHVHKKNLKKFML